MRERERDGQRESEREKERDTSKFQLDIWCPQCEERPFLFWFFLQQFRGRVLVGLLRDPLEKEEIFIRERRERDREERERGREREGRGESFERGREGKIMSWVTS